MGWGVGVIPDWMLLSAEEAAFWDAQPPLAPDVWFCGMFQEPYRPPTEAEARVPYVTALGSWKKPCVKKPTPIQWQARYAWAIAEACCLVPAKLYDWANRHQVWLGAHVEALIANRAWVFACFLQDLPLEGGQGQ